MAVTNPTFAPFVSAARRHLRDFPEFFEVDTGPLKTSTIRLPHPYVDGASLQVYSAVPPVEPDTEATMTLVPSTEWTCDERNGLLKFNDNSHAGEVILVAGYHVVWFLDEDLEFFASIVLGEHLHGRTITNIDYMDQAEIDAIGMGTLVHALWSLVTQLATEVDVTTPEGVHIPAQARFQQVQSLLGFWEGEYNKRAAALNVGLFSMQVLELRRVSRTTGRLVPKFVPREIDDPRPPRRVYHQIGTGETISVDTIQDAVRDEFTHADWRTVGTTGDEP